jgi:hypothetical protein
MISIGAATALCALSLVVFSSTLNAMNLFDEEYISTMGTGGFSLRGDRETLMAGQTRLLFVSVSTRF